MAAADPAPLRKRDRFRARMRRYVDVPLSVRTSDLPQRVASAVVMLAAAGTAIWIGGVVLRAFIYLVALAAFGAYRLTRASLAPVVAMGQTAARIGGGTLHERLPVLTPHDELGALAAVFNDLLARVEAASEAARRSEQARSKRRGTGRNRAVHLQRARARRKLAAASLIAHVSRCCEQQQAARRHSRAGESAECWMP